MLEEMNVQLRDLEAEYTSTMENMVKEKEDSQQTINRLNVCYMKLLSLTLVTLSIHLLVLA